MGKSLVMRIYYYTSENSVGQCGLWTAASTKQKLKEILDRHRINVDKVFRFEVNKGDGYHEVDVQKLVVMVTQHE
jgi:hypothetical protein